MKQVGKMCVGLLIGTVCSAFGQTPLLPKVYAIVGAKIEIGDGKTISKGTVVVRDGRIEAVGENVKPPADAEIIEGAGLTVYPGFVDSFSSTALKLPDAQPIQDTPFDPIASSSPSMREANRKGVRPELKAVDYFLPTDASVLSARKSGFVVQLLSPSGSLMSGQAGLVTLSGKPRRESVMKPVVGEVFGFNMGRSAERGYPATNLGYFAHVRQTLLDARRFQSQKAAYAKNKGMDRPPYDEVLTDLQPVLDGQIPALFEAENQNDIYRVLRFAQEFGMKPILVGGGEAYKDVETLAKGQVPVLLSLNFGKEPGAKPEKVTRPVIDPTRPGVKPAVKPGEKPVEKPVSPDDVQKPKPPQGEIKEDKDESEVEKAKDEGEESDVPKAATEERKRKWNEKVAGASTLSKAGVLFAFTTKGVKTPAEFFTNLRRAVKAGLPREAALRALTSSPAAIFGVSDLMGTITPGKAAFLTVMTGDFLEEKSKVKFLLIDREKIEPDKDKSAVPTRPTRLPQTDEFDPH
ncbi:MAG: amidohydrolase family protein [Chthonomonadaceae bacterium]|nr:amidohydrolase family protein [Chthonomonadaceae bacterium]